LKSTPFALAGDLFALPDGAVDTCTQAWLVVDNSQINQSNKVPIKSIQLFSLKHS
jgi:hypothetical protein